MHCTSKPSTSHNLTKKLEKPRIHPIATQEKEEDYFYTASLVFLKKKLEEKSNTDRDSQNTSQSCCTLSVPENLELLPKKTLLTETDSEPLQITGSSLSMHQILPFPKSHNRFFSRLKNTFRKYRSFFGMGDSKPNELGAFNPSPNLKFPRSERMHKTLYTSPLVEISEEASCENVSVKTKSRKSTSDISKAPIASREKR